MDAAGNKVVEATEHELYPKDDQFLLQYSKSGGIKFPFHVVPYGEELQPSQTPKTTPLIFAPLSQKLNKILASSHPCKFAFSRATTSGTSIFHYLFKQGKTRSKNLTFPHLMKHFVRIHPSWLWISSVTEQLRRASTPFSASVPRFEDASGDLQSPLEWVPQVAAEAEERHCSFVNIIITNQGQRGHRHNRAPAQHTEFWKCKQIWAHCCSRGQSTFCSIHPFWGRQGFFSKGLCSAVTENITFLLQYFPIFHLTKWLNAQERPPRVKTTVAGAVLLPVSLLAVVVLPGIFSSALSTSQLLLLLSKSGEGKIQHQTMLMQIQLHM